MKSIVSVFLSIIVSTASAGWQILSQGDFPCHIQAISGSPDGTILLAGGTSGVIARSTDSGVTWIFQESHTLRDLMGFGWQDSNNVWAGTGRFSGWLAGGDLLHSSDGGITWTSVISDYPALIMSVYFLDPLTGWAGESAAEYLKTTDGGASWNPIAETDAAVGYLYFLSSNIGFAYSSGLNFSIYRTSDGGNSWDEVYEDPYGTINGLSFPDASNGFVTSVRGVVASTDAGQTWTEKSVLPLWTYTSDFVTPLIGWVAGVRTDPGDYSGIIRKTSDGGISWDVQDLSIACGYNCIQALNPSLVIAGGEFGAMVSSNDGGLSWNILSNHFAYEIHDIEMVDSSNGWAAGAPSVILKTTDGGSHWDRATVTGTHNDFYDVSVVDNHIFVMGAYDFMASTDGGVSWQTRSGITNANSVIFSDSMNGWASAQYGMYKTMDGGITWEFNSVSGLGGIFDFQFLTSEIAFAAGGISTIVRTTDSGVTWEPIYNIPGNNSYLRAIHFPDMQYGYAVGDAGLIVATTDGGATWNQQTSPSGFDLMDVFFQSADSGMAVGDDGTILTTTNAGQTWLQETVSGSDLYSISIWGSSLWLAGQWGTVIIPEGTPQITATPTVVLPTATSTPTPVFTQVPTTTGTPVVSSTPTPNQTSTATQTSVFTRTSTPTSLQTFTPTRTPTSSGTSTPEVSPSPSGSPTPSVPPTATLTPTQTFTAVMTATQTPFPSVTRTPAATKTPSATPTPQADCDTTGVKLFMPSHVFTAGSKCFCSVDVCNADSEFMKYNPLFVILDILGQMYFAPTFSDFDYIEPDETGYKPGITTITIIPEFDWPPGLSPLNGLMFYAGLTDPAINHLVGQYDYWAFGWE